MAFVRRASRYRSSLGDADFPYEAGRYVLYVSYACPWANRAATVARLKQISPAELPVVSVHPTWQRTKPDVDSHCGWVFRAPGEGVVPLALLSDEEQVAVAKGSALSEVAPKDETDGKPPHTIATDNCAPDSYSGFEARTLRELYERCGESLERGGKFTTPLIFDRKQQKIVNNESSEIIVQLNNWPGKTSTAENPAGAMDLYPDELKEEIDAWNDYVYGAVNDGVYKCGFARSQDAYDAAMENLQQGMQKLEDHFKADGGKKKFLVGERLTLADVRLFQTLIRLDECYAVYFKTFAAQLSSFPHVLRYTARLYQIPEIKETTFVSDCKKHYFTSHPHLNPFAVIPKDTNLLHLLETMEV